MQSDTILDAIQLGFVCRLSLGGPLIPNTKQPALYKIPVLPVGERVLLHLTCTIGACGAVSVQPYVALPVSMTGQSAILLPPPVLSVCLIFSFANGEHGTCLSCMDSMEKPLTCWKQARQLGQRMTLSSAVTQAWCVQVKI